MKRVWLLALLALGALALALDTGAVTAQDKKGDTVELDGLKAPVPADWKTEKPANLMRYLQFKLPKNKDDKDDGELVVFKSLSGTAEANIKRWKEMFMPPDGKAIDDVAKVTDIKIGTIKAPYLDVSGTYKFKAAPFDPKAKTELKPGYRMLAIQLDGKNDTYHLRLVGPEKTVGQYKKGFDDWLQALK
jgi:hypothetical protein